MEGEKLGRLNYYSEGIIRAEIECTIPATGNWEQRYKPNALLILNEVINEILAMNLPQRPRSRVTELIVRPLFSLFFRSLRRSCSRFPVSMPDIGIFLKKSRFPSAMAWKRA
ncbi:MAG: hypothetical protein U5L07_15205 [Desulfobacterales bacterium]|nr:hypothetical protein [Desulfobacterales bacterium]